jgi:hypothetical protein
LALTHTGTTHPHHQLAGHCLIVGMHIGDLLSEHMPYDNQQFAPNCDDRLLFANALREPLKLRLPVQVRLDRDPGCFDNGSPQIAPAFFGDATTAWVWPESCTRAPKPA